MLYIHDCCFVLSFVIAFLTEVRKLEQNEDEDKVSASMLFESCVDCSGKHASTLLKFVIIIYSKLV